MPLTWTWPSVNGLPSLRYFFDAEMLVVAGIDKPVIALPAIGHDKVLGSTLSLDNIL